MKSVASRVTALVLLGAFAPLASAQSTFSSDATIKSALKNVDNLWWSMTAFEARLRKSAADPDLYINSTSLDLAPGWDPNLTFGS